MKKIPLTQGQFAIVDDEDFEVLSKNKWHAKKTGDSGYMAVRISPRPNSQTIYMHRQIMNTPPGMDTNHINHRTLDNRKSELRICTVSQNQQNSISHKGSVSRFKGVSWNKHNKKWQAQIRVDGKRVNLGYFDDEELAAKEYDAAAIKYFGEFACPNFSV